MDRIRQYSGKGVIQRDIRRRVTSLLNQLRNAMGSNSPEISRRANSTRLAGRAHRLLEPSALAQLANRCSTGNGEHRQSLEGVADQLRSLGPWRPLAAIPAPDAFDGLRDRFPNFEEVIVFAQGQIALAASTHARVAWLPPILLLGDPGIGKTAFAKALAREFGVAYFELPMNTMTAGFTLTGSDPSWSSAKPGRIFEILAFEGECNPIILLDEIDKAGGDSRYDPALALLSLLERTNARSFRDEYAGIPVDASAIIWLGTANTASSLPEPLLSRFRVFNVKAPDARQSARVCQSVYVSLRESSDWGHVFPEHLSADVIATLKVVSPRTMLRVLEEAAGRAVLSGRRSITLEDCHDIESARAPARIGF